MTTAKTAANDPVLKRFAVALGIAAVLCLLGFTTNNLSLMLACMLVSPILDIPLDFVMNEGAHQWKRLLILLALPCVGYVAGLIDPVKRSEMGNSFLNSAGKTYADNAPGSYIVGGVVALVCGVLLRRSASSPVIAVAINLATALLPQCLAIGYYLSNNFPLSDVLACMLVFVINVVGLACGAKLGAILRL